MNHWKRFLASSTGNKAFKSFKFTRPATSGEIAPLYKVDGSVTSEKKEQAELLFHGTSIAHIQADLSDIPYDWSPVTNDPNLDFSPLTVEELESVVNQLPKKKAAGPDHLANELIQTALPIISPPLLSILNASLKLGHFPTPWRTATTVIIRKHDKENYSQPNLYRPIALLSCLGKIYEKIITNRMTFWAETKGVLADSHMGGRKQSSVEDAGLILTSWIRCKWREGKVVAGLFLDVKSVYPSIHNRRLLHLLTGKGFPTYLLHGINGFLSERTTILRLQDYTSPPFDLDNGLPQGSPLSVILYILYNSSLVIPAKIEPRANEISIAFIDDVVHLVAHNDPEILVSKIEAHGQRSLEWGSRHGAIFDKKKTGLMYFRNKRKFKPVSIKFGDLQIQPQQKLCWLGFWLDPKLKFRQHISLMKAAGKSTIN